MYKATELHLHTVYIGNSKLKITLGVFIPKLTLLMKKFRGNSIDYILLISCLSGVVWVTLNEKMNSFNASNIQAYHIILTLTFIKHFEIFDALSKRMMTLMNFVTYVQKPKERKMDGSSFLQNHTS
jgi:hypothetical protein